MYYGSVPNWKIDCDDCRGPSASIKILNTIDKNNPWALEDPIYDFFVYEIPDDMILFLWIEKF